MENIECTFVMLKPDAFKRNIADIIIKDLKNAGYNIVMYTLTKIDDSNFELLYGFSVVGFMRVYGSEKGKEEFKKMREYLTTSYVMPMIISGPNAIKKVKELIGSTLNPSEQSLRGRYQDESAPIWMNLIHAADSRSEANEQTDIFFRKHELHQQLVNQLSIIKKKYLGKTMNSINNI
jgi:nucleoside-diphosphate kinase